jgi:hypothetical protein
MTIRYAKFFSRPHNAVIRVYDDAGNLIGLWRQSEALPIARANRLTISDARLRNSRRKDHRRVRMLHLTATYSRPIFWRYRLPQDCRAIMA